MDSLKDYIITVDDFPKPGVGFLDISPLLASPYRMRTLTEELHELTKDLEIDKIGGFDARGFLFGTPLSMYSLKPFFPIRKAGKLPGEVVTKDYGLEYGNSAISIQKSSINPGDRVLLIDDVLATGGTMKAGCDLVEELGGIVAGCIVPIELSFLPGKELLKLYVYNVISITQYEE